MAKLQVRLRGEVSEWTLGSFLITIGRHPDNNIAVDDRYVSGRHAVVGYDRGRYYVEDQKSSNGTLLNGKPVRRAWLDDGDSVRIGGLELTFVDEQVRSIPPPAAPTSGTPVPDTAEGALLDELVGSIRTHRERERSEREEAAARVRTEWDRWLILAEQLKAKVGDDPRVKYFGIDRRAQDVVIRIQRATGGTQQLITVALEHPDYRGHTSKGIWLIRTGETDRCLPTAQALATELIRELAFALA